ncbi:hypothetical protein [Thalassomonas sp. M1454]|uniref:hypothetical protein n=1 Tax=Thalassomonas sp. M1454 TaxID=2594477 RepID=UPI00117FCF7D|nr:hypothetical protein [Thalassomonas sp. M1454]TRX56955.1 hypothetical protein FNN08_05440 [Thalassomonas sp. M1454]
MKKQITILTLVIATILLVASNFYLSESNFSVKNANLCDFQQSECTKVSADLEIKLSTEPKVVKAESEIDFELQIKSLKPVKITSAWLEGKDMFMGKIPLFFNPSDISATNLPITVTAQTMIGACTEDTMVWIMNIALEIEGEARLIQFYFESER